MDFRILGPLEVHDGARTLTLGGTRQRALLALLLLHANEVVANDRLLEELWGAERVDDATTALRVAVSRLRRALAAGGPPERGGELLVTQAPGYKLCLDPGELDVQRFEAQAQAGRDALAGGDAALARETLTGALSLWRGPPLSDLGYESFAQTEIARLEDLRTAALEDRIAADLELGRHADVVAELHELAQRHPLRERVREQLMLALYRSGRQADALEVFMSARAALTGELGIEPGRELRELQEAILRQDPLLDPPAGGGSAASPGRGVFVGRERELAQLGGALDDVLGGHGRLVLLAGEPGIGKSQLADELLRRARARGARVLVGRCWEAGGAPAYWPWVQSLRAYARELEPGDLRAQLGAGAPELSQLMPELRELIPELPEPPASPSEGDRFRLFEAASLFLRNATEARPVVLMLDDLHAADEPSLLLLRFVARELAGSRLLVLCAFRDVDPTLQAPLIATLAELVREPQTAQIELGGLNEPDLASYIERSTGIEPAPLLVQAIHAETEGNPLFVAEVVRLLDAEGGLTEAGAHQRIPPGVRVVIGQRVGRLSDRCRGLLAPASVMGREFGLDTLAHMSELSGDGLLDVLDEALTERVVAEVPGSPGRLRFSHVLIRDTLYDELGSGRRLRLHQDAVAALEKAHSGDLEPHLAELAHHSFAAGAAGEPARAVGYARRAGDRAAAQLAFEEAVRLYEMALTLVGEDRARCELLLALGDAQGRSGDTPGLKDSFRRAADLAERLGLAEELARAALGYGGRLLWEVSRGDTDHVPLLERALAALGSGDSELRVRLLARLSGGPLRDTSYPSERRRSLSEEALAMARRLGAPGTLAYALSGYIAANHAPDFAERQVTLGTELIQLSLETGDRERAAEGYEHRATALIELGEMRRAKADFAALATTAQELRQPSQEWFVEVYGALVDLLEGRLAEAERSIEAALRVGERAQSWNAAVSYGLQLYLLRREQGRVSEIEDLVRRSVEEYPGYPIWRCVLAHMAGELGYVPEARAVVAALAADDFASVPFDEEWLVSMSLIAETTCALGEAELAEALYERLLPYADRVAISYPEVSCGAVARYLGLLATTAGAWDDAEQCFRQAVEVHERIGAESWLARTRRDHAAMLTARDAAPAR